MELYCYYQKGIGLFTNTSADVWEDDAHTMVANEQLLIQLSFEKLSAYNLDHANYEYIINSKFAQQPGIVGLLRWTNFFYKKYINESYVSDAAYFTQIQFDNGMLAP